MNAAAHPLHDFRVTASVDWLRLRLTTQHPTQARHLRAKLPAAWRPFVEPAPGSDPNACANWALTIQDPPRTSVVAQTLLTVLGLNPDQIAADAIEVSLDFLPKGQNAYSRLDQVAYHLHRHHAHPPLGTPRITEPGHFRAAAGQRDILDALRGGFTINTATHKDADHRSRVYIKRQDSSQGNQYHPLPQTQHRARLEVILAGSTLRTSAPTLAALVALRFETLAPRFALVVDVATSSPLTAMLRPFQTQRGRARTPGGRRLSQRGTRRDTATNKRVHDALRSLTSRQSDAEISGRKIAIDTAPSEGSTIDTGDSPKYLICQATDTTQAQPTARHQQAGRTRPEGADGPTQADPDHQDTHVASTSTTRTATRPRGRPQQGPPPNPSTAQGSRTDQASKGGHAATGPQQTLHPLARTGTDQ